ncbi:hypothetical protein N7510_003176 [Penicillium lagena]|uniref:uncharacterized protein n=1 Tax=Penicillium lagena TaxID=94218 RepID=UPI0025400EB7|nr:uncharacterized protein N7510_003176 [Penicillium lagena]KAJ5619192.1 hypothetical protein N7510_003176 [Penicillium lagena]
MENEQLFEAEVEAETQRHAQQSCRCRLTCLKWARAVLPGTAEDEPHSEQPRETGSRWSWKGFREPSIFWLFPFILLFTLGFGGIAVPKINLILTLLCRDYLSERAAQDPSFTYLPVLSGDENPYCRVPQVQSLVARFQLYINLIAGILSALVSPRIGHLSDRYGRTKVIALCAFGCVLNESITVMVATWPDQMSVNWILVGAVFDGLGGSFTTALALLNSYAADCTSPDRRNVAFGFFQGALFFGIAVGPTLAAILIKKTGGPLLVFYLALSFHALFLLGVFFVVPESLSKERQGIAREKHRRKSVDDTGSSWSLRTLNPMNLITPLSILLPAVGRPSVLFANRRGASAALRRNIILLAAIDTAAFGVAMGTVQVIIIYAEYMFHWGNVESSLFVSIVNVVRVGTLLVVFPIVAHFFRTPSPDDGRIRGSDMMDVVVIRMSLVFDILGYVGYALSKHPSVMILSGITASLGGMGSPILQSSLTKHVPHERIGQMLGATGLLHALARVVAPTVFNLIYSLTVATFPQTVFICLASVFVVALGLSFLIRPHVSLEVEPTSDLREANEEGEDEYDQLLVN